MNRRERTMLIVAMLLLGGIVFKFLIYDPQQAEYATLVSARDTVAAELARDQQVIARAPAAQAEYNRMRAYIAAVEQKLPQRKEIPALLTAMEQFTRRVGVSFQSIRPGALTAVTAPPPAPSAPRAGGHATFSGARQATTAGRAVAYSSMPVDIVLGGTFAQTVEYLRELRNFPRLVIVNSISLTPLGFPKLGIAIHAQIYTLGTPSGQTGGTP